MDVAPEPMPPQVSPGVASAEAGVVMLDGPDGVAVAMLPDAAEETGRRLMAAAQEARGQSGDAT
jgi:hypothetical protein